MTDHNTQPEVQHGTQPAGQPEVQHGTQPAPPPVEEAEQGTDHTEADAPAEGSEAPAEPIGVVPVYAGGDEVPPRDDSDDSAAADDSDDTDD